MRGQNRASERHSGGTIERAQDILRDHADGGEGMRDRNRITLFTQVRTQQDNITITLRGQSGERRDVYPHSVAGRPDTRLDSVGEKRAGDTRSTHDRYVPHRGNPLTTLCSTVM
ncbi:hypothetical protein GCM10022198_01130 [Klugiella xanthotipulae]